MKMEMSDELLENISKLVDETILAGSTMTERRWERGLYNLHWNIRKEFLMELIIGWHLQGYVDEDSWDELLKISLELFKQYLDCEL